MRPSFLIGLIIVLAGFPVIATPGSLKQDFSLLLEDFGRGDYAVEGHFHVTASRPLVWQVLTDYDHMPQFISSMRRSTVQERSKDRLLLQQEALGRLLVFSRKIEVLLSVQEMPMSQIIFEDIGNKDFSDYQGSWEIREDGHNHLAVIYRLNAKRKFSAPGYFAKVAFQKSAESLLNEVRAEIIRRQERSAL